MPRFTWLLILTFAAALMVGCPEGDDDDSTGDDDDATADDDDATADDDDDDTGDDDDTHSTDDMDGDGYSPADGDCDDENPDVNPGEEEVPYDGLDNDCEGGDELDADGDGHDADWFGGTDCNDEDAGINPDATEVCGDEVDRDCSGDPDDGTTDADGDGYIDWACTVGDDCDDGDSGVHPEMTVDVPGDHATVTDAAAAVCNDSTIHVDEGNYYGNVEAAGKSLRILGTGDPAATFLIGDGAGTVVVLGDGGVQSQLTNVTVLSGDGVDGGGLSCTGDCLVENCGFSDNVAYFGAGIALIEADPFSIVDCTFADNIGDWGGGLYVIDSVGSVAGTLFENNTALAGGGGISGWDSEIDMSDLTVVDNTGDQGGGLHIYTCTGSLSDSILSGNFAQTAGGMQTRDTTIDLLDNAITNNHAEWGGGGYYCWDSTVTSFETNEISANTVYDCDDYVYPDCIQSACRNCSGC